MQASPGFQHVSGRACVSVTCQPHAPFPRAVQLREALSANAVRAIDLFKDWDDDESGSVSKKEFRKAMKELGFDAPREEVSCKSTVQAQRIACMADSNNLILAMSLAA